MHLFVRSFISRRCVDSSRALCAREMYFRTSARVAAVGDTWLSENKSENKMKADSSQQANTAKASIYVGNLPFTFTEEDLIALARSRDVPTDTLKACRIEKSLKGKSRGFGYMDFFTEQQARACLPLFFHSISINGREITFDLDSAKSQITAEEREKSAKWSEFCLFLGNLAYDVDENMLRTHIVEYMRAAHASACAVSVAKAAAARKAIRSDTTSAATTSEKSNTNLTIANPDSGISTEIPSEFEEPVIKFKLNRDKVVNGYALAHFADMRAMTSAMEAIRYTDLNGRALNVTVYKASAQKSRGALETDRYRGSERAPATADAFVQESKSGYARNAERFVTSKNSLYIGNLHFKATHEEILACIVGALGPNRVRRLRLSMNKYKNQHNGFGHIDFYHSVEATAALEELTGISVKNRRILASPAGGPLTREGEGDESDHSHRTRGVEYLPRLED